MHIIRNVAGQYWVGYYLVYVAVAAAGAVTYRRSLLQGTDTEPIYTLAAILGSAAGLAALTAILLEVLGRMVLLIPNAVTKILEKGRREGREVGREEGREEERERFRLFMEEHGISITPEQAKILFEKPKDS